MKMSIKRISIFVLLLGMVLAVIAGCMSERDEGSYYTRAIYLTISLIILTVLLLLLTVLLLINNKTRSLYKKRDKLLRAVNQAAALLPLLVAVSSSA